MNEQYRINEALKLDYNRECIVRKRFIFFDRIELYINEAYIAIYGYPSNDGKTLCGNLMYITNTKKPITKEILIESMKLDSSDRYYIGYGDLLVDARSYVSIENIAIINELKEFFEYLNAEFEEAFDWLNHFILDYLNQYPEDKII